MRTFKADFSRIIEKAKGRVDLVVQKATAGVFDSVIMKSPVDTGRFRANWIASANSYGTMTLDAVDKSGSDTVNAASAVALGTKAGGIVYLVNNLPYASRLEYGYSDQAPNGMVRLSVAEFEQWVAKAARF